MINPSNVPSVEGAETLSRYVLQSKHFRKNDNTARPELFMPHPHQDLSVTRHKDATEDELWQVGTEVARKRSKTLYGRFDIQVSDCEIGQLKVKAKPLDNNPNHADITGWPSSKLEQKALALEIAASESLSTLISPDSFDKT